MFAKSPWNYPEFQFKDLHRKIGQLVFVTPTESDIAEGDFMEQLWFCDADRNMYLLHESDIRLAKKRGEKRRGEK